MHTYKQRVYYSDTDCGGIVYHARYLDFAEHARTELLRELASAANVNGTQNALIEELNLIFVVKSIEIDYIKPALMDDMLEVRTTLEQSKRFSMLFKQVVLRGEEELSVLFVKVASIHSETHRPVAIPEWFAPEVEKL